VVNGQLRFSRSLGTGTDDFALDGGGASPDIAPIVRKLKRSLAGFAHEEFGSPPEKLVLTGPGSETPGIDGSLSKALDLPVVIQNGLELGKPEEPVSPFVCAIGLALEEAESEYHINLVPEEIYQKYESARRKRFLVNASFLLFINLALLGGIVGHAFWHKQQVLAIIDSKIQKIQPSLAGIDTIAEKLDVIDANIDRDHSAFKVLTNLFEITPERVRFERLTFNKSESLQLDLETFEYRDTNDFKTILSKSPHFAGAIEGGNQQTQNFNPQQWKFRRTLNVRGLEAFLATNRKFKE
jgi:Tfp pilus assembly protein PilN